MKTLSVIGAGKAGKTVARLLKQGEVFCLKELCNARRQSAEQAVEFIGAGAVVEGVAACSPADVYMLSCADDQIEQIARKLSEAKGFKRGSVVFHLSGTHTSDTLAPLRSCGALLASVHPVKSFANPDLAISSFAGTFCGVEGDEGALALLIPAFESIGGRCTRIAKDKKSLYHSAPIFACNYLTTLFEVSFVLYEQAGIAREQAVEILQPLVTETLRNNLSTGPALALSGPIARGDTAVLKQHLRDLVKQDEELARVYAALGSLTVRLLAKDGGKSQKQIQQLQALFAEYFV